MKTIKRGLALILAMLVLVMGMPLSALASAATTGLIELELDVPVTVVTNSSVNNGNVTLYFTPEETGVYAFTSIGDVDTVATLYEDGISNPLRYDDDSGEGNNFKLECRLVAGVTYKLVTHRNNNGDGTFEVVVTTSDTVTVVDVDFHDLTVVEGYNFDIVGEQTPDGVVRYEKYTYQPKYTVYYSDGTSQEESSWWLWDGFEQQQVVFEDDQSPTNTWGVGEHSVTASVAGITDTITVTVEENPVDYVEVIPMVFPEGTNGYLDYDYNDDTGEQTDYYFRYQTLTSTYFTVHFKDGTSWNGEGEYYYKDMYVSFELEDNDDNQSFNNQWGLGTHTQTVSFLGYKFDYPVEIVETPVASVDCGPLVVLENTNGHWKQDSFWNEELGQYEYSEEYFIYYPSFPNVTITLKDGTVINGSDFDWNYVYYSINYKNPQNYQNRWLADNTYTIDCNIAGYEFPVDVQIVSKPIASVECKPLQIIENTNGNYSWGSYWDEELGKYVDGPKYFRYELPWPEEDDITVTLVDGTVITGTRFEWNGMEFSASYHQMPEQSYENQWTAGNTYNITMTFGGFEFIRQVEILPSPVVSVTTNPTQLIENSFGSYTTDTEYDWELGEWVPSSPEYFQYDVPSFNNFVIHFADGSQVTSDEYFRNHGIEYDGNWYSFQHYGTDQSYDNQWTVGNTYQVPLSILGYNFTYDVEIIPSPVVSVTSDDILIFEGSDGYYTSDEVWDEELGEWVPVSPEYFVYNTRWPENAVITLRDGSVFRGHGFEYNGQWHSMTIFGNQSYQNQWTVGNTYQVEGEILGYKFTYNVEIAPSPVASVTCDKTTFLEGTNGRYFTDEIWDDEFGYIYSDEYFRYYTPWPNNMTITLKDGTVINGSSFDYKGKHFDLSVTDNQSFENQWTAGNTYYATGSIAGFEFPIEVEIVETPVSSVVVEPIQLTEGLNGYYTWESIWDEKNEEWIEGEYFHYETPWPQNITITLKDGTVFNDTEIRVGDRWYSVNIESTGQSVANPWLPGNVYEVEASIAGFDFTFEVEIIQLSSNDYFEFIETEDSITITNSFNIEDETLEIPAEINGKPVVSVVDLSIWDVRHLIFPDTVEFIGDYVISGAPNLETVTFGSSVSNLDKYTFQESWSLTNITVADNNPYYKDIDGVLYNKAGNKLIAYPICKSDIYTVPKSVTNIDALDLPIYFDVRVVFPADHPDFVTVDGVTYTKDMKTVVSCSPDKSGSYVMPESVTKIKDRAFQYSNLSEVTISSQVSTIVYRAFYSCASLTKVNLPENLVSIDDRAFENTHNLTSIDLPNNLSHIGAYSFSSSGLTSLTLPESVFYVESNAFSYSNIAELDLGNVNAVEDEAFMGTPVTSVTLPDSLTYLGSSAFEYCSHLSELTIGSGLDYIPNCAFKNTGIETLVIPSTIKVLKAGAFQNSSISSLTLNEGIKTIESNVFDDCENLTSIHIPASVEYLYSDNFSSCDSLTSLTVAKENPVFYSRNNCIIGRLEIGDVIGHGCGASVIPDDGSIYAIYFDAFKDCDALESISIPSSVVGIAGSAFEDCDNLQTVTFNEGLKEILDWSFYECDALNNVVLPDSLESIGISAFESCYNLTNLTMGENVDFVGKSAFAYSPVTDIEFGNNVSYIGAGAFFRTDIPTFVIPSSVTGIMYETFFGCEELTSVEIPLSVEHIDERAFGECFNLTDVYYQGSEEDRANMYIEAYGNETLIKANWHYNWVNDSWSDTPVVPDVPTCPHLYDNACDTNCNLCGEVRITAGHIYDDGCDRNCNECGAERPTAHLYDNACDATCNECGAERPVGDHIYTNDCDASCNECGATRVPGDHVYDNACDADCNRCGATRTPAAHVYSNNCDADCNVCGATRVPASHVYDNACDADCNECEETRAPAAHVYDNGCDTTCNVCGKTRTVSGHVYTNNCDATCNVCGAERPVGDHVYTNDCDASCDVCGATRVPGDHVYTNACDADCNRCGATRVPAAHVYDDEYDATCNVCGEERSVPERPVDPSNNPTFTVTGDTVKAGDTFTVDVAIKNNPGICALGVAVGYDASLLELVSATGGALFAGTSFGPTTSNPFMISWVNSLAENASNGTVATLTFKVKDDAVVGTTNITLTYDPNNVYDFNFENVYFETENGKVDIIEYIPGDANDDGQINNKDVGLIQRFINGWSVNIIEDAADVNKDGSVNNKDVGLLQRYINGWNVELK